MFIFFNIPKIKNGFYKKNPQLIKLFYLLIFNSWKFGCSINRNPLNECEVKNKYL